MPQARKKNKRPPKEGKRAAARHVDRHSKSAAALERHARGVEQPVQGALFCCWVLLFFGFVRFCSFLFVFVCVCLFLFV